MPIMDGYETCCNIVNLFTSQNIFKQGESRSGESELYVPLVNYLPVIVALSSLITPYIKNKTKESGFVLSLQSPLHSKTIETEIQPLLNIR